MAKRAYDEYHAGKDKAKFEEIFEFDRMAPKEPIMLYDKDISNMRVKQIYEHVKQHHLNNGQDFSKFNSEEAKLLQLSRERQKNKLRNFKIWIDLYPERFKPTHVEEYLIIQKQTQKCLPLAGLSFLFASGVKFFAFYKNSSPNVAAGLIVGLYAPSFGYYMYWKSKESDYIRSIFHEYDF